jgi:serine/threonine-protein kinase
MKVLCTRPNCPHPFNQFPELNDSSHLKTTSQKYCINCGMPLILGGRYIPLKLLGKGGFGTAFLAIDRYTPTLRKCVVKQFQPDENLGEEEFKLAEKLFEREALVLENLGNRHPQIPDLFAFFPLIIPSRNGQPEEHYFYLVQEFIDGQDLAKELEQKGKFSEAEVTEILREVLNILDFVHNNNSIHRDIKPSNIIRNREGKLYLLDFGAVKLVTTGAVKPETTSTGIYSMGFAPPEQMSGSQVFPATDLYALAVTCLNLLTGKPTSELYDAYNNKWKWQQYAPQISERLSLILEKMLLHSPAKRFQSAKEVLRFLKPSPSSNSVVSISPPVQVNPSSSSAPVNQPSPITTPSPISSSPPVQAKPQSKAKIRRLPPLPLVPLLSSSAFAGFESVLLAIALMSGLPNLSFHLLLGIWGGCIGLMIFSLLTRLLENWDLLIFAVISLALVYFLPFLHSYILKEQLEVIYVIILPLVAGVALTAVTSVCLLLYKILSRIF